MNRLYSSTVVMETRSVDDVGLLSEISYDVTLAEDPYPDVLGELISACMVISVT